MLLHLHMYTENSTLNTKAENLSKDALLLQDGTFIEQVFREATILAASEYYFY